MPSSRLLDEIRAAYGDDTERLLKDLEAHARPRRTARRKGPASPALVSVRQVSKRYRLGRTVVEALQDVSLEVGEGEIVALTGPSGSGKSTLLNLIGGLDRPTSGSVEVAGVKVEELRGGAMARYRAEKLGFVFQFFYLQPFLSLKTNVKVPTMFVPMKEEERERRADAYIEGVGLADRASHLPRELSGGQMQRAAIARALMNEPPLILADEPTGNLDSVNADAVMDLLEQIRDQHGTAVVVVTHDPRVARRADRTVELRDGRVL